MDRSLVRSSRATSTRTTACWRPSTGRAPSTPGTRRIGGPRYGFDVQEPYEQRAALRAFLEKAAPDRAAPLIKGLDRCLGVGASSWDDLHASAEWKEFAAATELSEESYGACLAGTDALADALQADERAILAKASPAELRRARLSLANLRGFERQSCFQKRHSSSGARRAMTGCYAPSRRSRPWTSLAGGWSRSTMSTSARMDEASGAVSMSTAFMGRA